MTVARERDERGARPWRWRSFACWRRRRARCEHPRLPAARGRTRLGGQRGLDEIPQVRRRRDAPARSARHRPPPGAPGGLRLLLLRRRRRMRGPEHPDRQDGAQSPGAGAQAKAATRRQWHSNAKRERARILAALERARLPRWAEAPATASCATAAHRSSTSCSGDPGCKVRQACRREAASAPARRTAGRSAASCVPTAASRSPRRPASSARSASGPATATSSRCLRHPRRSISTATRRTANPPARVPRSSSTITAPTARRADAMMSVAPSEPYSALPTAYLYKAEGPIAARRHAAATRRRISRSSPAKPPSPSPPSRKRPSR